MPAVPAILIACTILFFSATANSRVLVIAPHPDDDVIMAAGVTFRAVASGEPVTVVYMTNGDFAGVESGYQREAEAVAGQAIFGNAESNLIFLGYPDGYLQTLYADYPLQTDQFTAPTGQSTTYGNRGLGSSDYHAYKFGAPAPYNLISMVTDLAQIIRENRPDHVIVTAEYDQHPDHAATYNVLTLALRAALPDTANYFPTVHKTIIHWNGDNGWPLAMDPTEYFTEPPNLGTTNLAWTARESLDVPLSMQSLNNQQNQKYLATMAQASQSSYSYYLTQFIHKDEFFWIDTSLGNGSHAPAANAGTGKTVTQGSLVTLDGSASLNADGGPVTYQWSQLSGATVQLSDPTAASPTFTAPDQTGQITFQLVTSNGQLKSLPDMVGVIVQPAAQENIALLAQATASSDSPQYSQTASKVVDGYAEGYSNGDYTHEWATAGERAGAWVRLTWNVPYLVNTVALFDRPNSDDQILAGTLTFGDGTTMQVGPLNNDGTITQYSVSPPRSTTSLTLTVDSVSGATQNVGLAEIQVFGKRDANVNSAPVANAGPDQTAAQGAFVTLDGSASRDWDGDSITFSWTQVSGTTVQLAGANTVNPSFTVPTGTAYEQLVFQLVVNDGKSNSVADTVTITEEVPAPTCTNIAPLAQVTASSDTPLDGQTASKAVDGYTDGYPSGDYTHEWATARQGAGAWLRLTWNTAQTVSGVTLFDRPNSADQILGGVISFNDGTTIQVGPLDNLGVPTPYWFAPKTITSLMLNVSQVSSSTWAAGLAEIQVCGASAGDNQAPVANAGANQVVTQGAFVTLDGSASSDPNGSAITYSWSQTSGPSVPLSDPAVANPTFTAPVGSSESVEVTFQLVVSDGQLASTPSTVTVTVQPQVQACTDIAPLAQVTASSDTPLYGQTASKAVDGYTDGYSTGDYTHEWATAGQGAGAWLRLTWNTAQMVSGVTLFDRPNGDDQVVSGTITFDDGTSVSIGPLDNAGAATSYTFPAKSTTTLTFTVTEAGTRTFNVGLAEIRVCGVSQ
jgi:LmbE family N-acetylglucosaminyl deacetylase